MPTSDSLTLHNTITSVLSSSTKKSILPAVTNNTKITQATKASSMTLAAESALIAAAAAGEPRAYELLILKYQYGLVRFLDQIVRDPMEAEDLAQEAFIRAYRALDTFRGDSSFFTWLRRIGLNLARDYLRSRRRQPIMVEESVAMDNLSEENSPDMILQQKQLAESIQSALEELPEKWRMPLMLREVDGLDYQEIATMLEIPMGTVRSRIFRARNAVAAKLEPLTDKIKTSQRW